MRRYAMLFGAMLLTLGLATAVTTDPVGAQEIPRPELSAESLIETARAALAKGELEDAEFLLLGIKPGEGNAHDLDFLHGSVAMAREDYIVCPKPTAERPKVRAFREWLIAEVKADAEGMTALGILPPLDSPTNRE